MLFRLPHSRNARNRDESGAPVRSTLSVRETHARCPEDERYIPSMLVLGVLASIVSVAYIARAQRPRCAVMPQLIQCVARGGDCVIAGGHHHPGSSPIKSLAELQEDAECYYRLPRAHRR